MERDCYFYSSRLGEVVICRNEERPSLWDLWIGEKLICPQHYNCPEEAALRASERDFGDEELNKTYVGLRVPENLDEWKLRESIGA
jgi:hypothetical protein